MASREPQRRQRRLALLCEEKRSKKKRKRSGDNDEEKRVAIVYRPPLKTYKRWEFKILNTLHWRAMIDMGRQYGAGTMQFWQRDDGSLVCACQKRSKDGPVFSCETRFYPDTVETTYFRAASTRDKDRLTFETRQHHAISMHKLHDNACAVPIWKNQTLTIQITGESRGQRVILIWEGKTHMVVDHLEWFLLDRVYCEQDSFAHLNCVTAHFPKSLPLVAGHKQQDCWTISAENEIVNTTPRQHQLAFNADQLKSIARLAHSSNETRIRRGQTRFDPRLVLEFPLTPEILDVLDELESFLLPDISLLVIDWLDWYRGCNSMTTVAIY